MGKLETLFSFRYREAMQGQLKAALGDDSLVLCLALINTRTPDVPAIAAAGGYDAVYVDLEHTTTSLETAAMLCASAIGAGIAGLVRVPSHDPSLITRVLDAGAVGVIVPHVSTAAETRSVVDAARYPPVGQRSIAGPNPVSGYRPLSPTELTRSIDSQTVVSVMIEDPLGVRNSAAIAAVDGLDMILIGPSDLTAAMGIHGQYDHPEFRGAVRAVAAACRGRGVALGIAGIQSVGQLAEFVELGVRFISAGTDVGMLTAAVTTRAQELRALATDHQKQRDPAPVPE